MIKLSNEITWIAFSSFFFALGSNSSFALLNQIKFSTRWKTSTLIRSGNSSRTHLLSRKAPEPEQCRKKEKNIGMERRIRISAVAAGAAAASASNSKAQ